MKTNYRIVDDLLKYIGKHFDKNPQNMFFIYDNCLKYAKVKKVDLNKKTITLSRDEVVSIYNNRFQIIFKKRRNDCVPSSLALHFLLYLFGYDSVFYIGVYRFPFSSHAWVEDFNGNILNSFPHLCKDRIILLEKRLLCNDL